MSQDAILYGIGVGPGDPELLTLKAVRIMESCSVIAYPAANGNDSLARHIARQFIAKGCIELAIDVPMTTARGPAVAAYDEAASEFCTHLSVGHSVAFLCEGDPFFYGSFMYLYQRLAEKFPSEIIPGVSSITAAAAVCGQPLAARNDILKVLPATLPEEILAAEIGTGQAFVFIKIGRHFSKIRRLLTDAGLDKKARIIEAATRPDQHIGKLDDFDDDQRPYFSTILVYCGEETW